MILSLKSILAALSSKIESWNNNKKIETMQEAIEQLESKIKDNQMPLQN